MQQQVYKKFSNGKNSEMLTIFEDNGKFTFNHQTFKRSNPSQLQRKLGFKPKRVLISEQSYEFTNLENVDLNTYPFSDLVKEFTTY